MGPGDLTGQLFYRARRRGWAVFRVETDARHGRLDLVPVATITAKGEIRDSRRNPPSEAERDAMADHLAAAERTVPADHPETMARQINLIADWAQREAEADELRAHADRLLLAMHDLRAVIVRRLAGEGPKD